jgi:hypothetical protein
MLDLTVTMSELYDVADAEPDGFRVGYVAEDGTALGAASGCV